jgi:hypothetical protein
MTRVLLVDDNPVVLAVYRSGLSMAGFTVDTANDGEAALATAAAVVAEGPWLAHPIDDSGARRASSRAPLNASTRFQKTGDGVRLRASH